MAICAARRLQQFAVKYVCRCHSKVVQRNDNSVMALSTWLEQNGHLLKPPVANRQIYKDAVKVMVVGGPNQRTDYHLQWGEELFWQLKGNLCVKIVQEGNVKRDVHLPAGYVWLLPGQILHNPQREAESIGIVFERERQLHELDAMQWFSESNPSKLRYREWFHCHDLGTQLKPVIERYFEMEEECSKQDKADVGITGLDADSTDTPTPLLDTIVPGQPFHLMDHLSTLSVGASHRIFDSEFVMDAHIGPCETQLTMELNGDIPCEAFVYQLEGRGSVLQADEEKLFNDGDVSMVRDPESARIRLGQGAVAVTVSNRVARKLSETQLRVSQIMSTHVTAM